MQGYEIAFTYPRDVQRCLDGRTLFSGADEWYGVAQGDIQFGERLALLFSEQYIPFTIREFCDKFKVVGVARGPLDIQEATIAQIGRSLVDISLV